MLPVSPPTPRVSSASKLPAPLTTEVILYIHAYNNESCDVFYLLQKQKRLAMLEQAEALTSLSQPDAADTLAFGLIPPTHQNAIVLAS